MRRAPLLLTAAALLGAALGSCSRQVEIPPLPPYERPQGSAIVPVFDPEESLAKMRVPEGYRVELVAAEPLVQEPVRIQFGPDGKLWVVEMRGYMPNIEDDGADVPNGRITVLEDLNNDGRMDRRTVFVDSLVLPRALAVLEQGILFAAPPYMILARDTDGDLRADVQDTLSTAYANNGGNVEHLGNGFLWGIDNWLHSSEWPEQHRLIGGKFETRRTPSQGQWGISMDEYGRIFRNTNEDPLRMDYVSAHYATRNPNLPTVRGVYERLTANVEVFPGHKTPAINRGYRPQTMRPDSTLAHYTGVNSPVMYLGDQLPEELRNDVFLAEPVANFVGRLEVSQNPNGLLTAKRVDDRTEFLISTDERFRPVFIANAPDGTLYVADMYRGIIQHLFYITGYLREQIVARGMEQPTGLGRIYRIVHESTERVPQPRLNRLSSPRLVPYLEHENGWYRINAQRMIVERGGTSAVAPLKRMLGRSDDDRARLHALWTLDGLGQVDDATLTAALADASPHVRAAAVRISEPRLAQPGHPVTARVLALLDDSSPMVQWQLAASLGELPAGEREVSLAQVVQRHGTNPLVPDLVVSGLAGRELPFLERLLGVQGAQPQVVAPTAAVLSGAILRSRNAAAVQRLVELAGDPSRPRELRLALLPATGGGGGGGGGGAQPLQLASAPQALLTLAEGNDPDLSARARALANALTWPGKPTPPRPPVRPLTDQEQQYYLAGQAQYNGLCVACHGPNGAGIPGVGKPLAGSRIVLGNPTAAIRVVLHGKEGDVGLMPPMGGTLTNEAVAAVLTYIRRSWGNEADPVSPAAVSEVRGSTLGRTRPWTDETLDDRG